MKHGEQKEWLGWFRFGSLSAENHMPSEDHKRLPGPREVLEPHLETMDGLRLESGLAAPQFSELFESVVTALTEYVYLLPATRAENHADPAGLLRLAIESAVLAFRRAEGQFLTGPVHTDVHNRERDRIWRYAIFLGALFCPVGRCCTSLRVIAKGDKLVWFPHAEGLWQWLQRESICGFDLEWRDGTDIRPERACSLWLLGRLLPESALRYLSPAGERAMEALVQMTVGAGVGRTCEIVEEAQQAAIDRDLLRLGRTRGVSSSGMPLEHRLLDAIRSLVREKWTLNTPGGRIWVTREGVFLAWKPAVTDIAVKLRADGLGGVPRDPDTLAEVLLARGALVPNSDSTSSLKHYFRITPVMRGMPKQSIEAVKFADSEMVGLNANAVEPVELEMVVSRVDAVPAMLGARGGAKIPQGKPARAGSAGASTKAGTSNGSLELPFATTAPSELESGPATPTSAVVISPPAVGSRSRFVSDPVATPGKEMPSTTMSERLASAEKPPAINAELQLASSFPGLSRLAQFGAAGPTLCALAERLLNEPHLAGVVSTSEGVAIAYPQVISPFCPEPQHFLSSCESQGLLVADKAAGRLVHKRGADAALPEQYIVLSPRIARYLPLPPSVASHVVAAS